MSGVLEHDHKLDWQHSFCALCRSPWPGCKRPEAWQRCTGQSTDSDVPAHHVSHQYEEQRRESACCRKCAREASSNHEAVRRCEACRCLSWHLPLTTWRQSKSSWKWVMTRQAKVHLSACFRATDLRNHSLERTLRTPEAMLGLTVQALCRSGLSRSLLPGRTALILAAAHGRTDCLKELLTSRANKAGLHEMVREIATFASSELCVRGLKRCLADVSVNGYRAT